MVLTRSSGILIRFSGSFSSKLLKRSTSAGFSSSGIVGSSVLMASYISIIPSLLNGIRPYLRQKSDTPMDQMSAALPDTSPCLPHSSGGKNAGEPADLAVFMSLGLSNIWETPKSTTFRTSFSESNRLSGLMSL